MANVVVALYNFLLRSGNKNACPPFYEGFIKGLEKHGNNVLCFQWSLPQLNLNNKIPDKYLDKIKRFKPDLFIFFNNQFWDVSRYFDAPIIIYDVDSPNAYCNINQIKTNNSRYKFIVNQYSGIEFVQDIIGCPKENIKYIIPYTAIEAEEKEIIANISFCGSNWFWTDFKCIYDLIKTNPTDIDRKAARIVYNLYLQNPLMTANEIYEKFEIEATNRIKFQELFYHACRVSGIDRLRVLSAISDLGLEIRGQYWKDNMSLLPFPEVLLSYSHRPIHSIQDTADFFNSTKISINTKHIQAQSGFSWRVCDILASNACLVSQPASDLDELGFKIPTFTSPAEARDICIKLLNNENMRKDIVAHSQEIINKNHRFSNILPIIEDFVGMQLHSNLIGNLENIYIFKEQENNKTPKKEITSFNQFPNVSIKNLSWNKKFYYVISRYFFKCFEKKRRMNMKVGDKFCIRFFGFNLIELKKRSEGTFDSYVMGVPLFTTKAINFNYSISLLAYNKVRALYMKRKEQKRIKNARKAIIDKFKDGKKLNICIQVCRPGLWNLDYLYKILDESPYFNPSILIMPDKAYKREMHELYARQTYDELVQRGYKPFKGYDFDKEKIIDIRKEINPDIILFTDFWKPHFFDTFYINRFRDKITFLNEYGFSVRQDELTCNFELNNLVDLYFRPTQVHVEMAQKLMNNKGINVLAVGHPKIDALLDENTNFNDVWKAQYKPKKRIIWAPHYNANTPKTMYQNDAFYILYDFMLDIAEKYKEEVQFVFRPHPVLYQALEKKWGLEDVKKYYQKWDELDNGQYYAGNFVDLFATSDAMIMDSCSFMAEYTAFNKPLFHTVTQTSRTHLNEFGEILYKNFYTPINELESDIENFIQDVVINGNDYKKEERTEFVKQYFGKINGKTASENIYDEIIKFLEKGEV
ncbi:glycosyltransferase family protein [Campylobacter devanensis]|uniref:glycosyltransferase family protein n=1 Tax=Campylobacter devanensis TaxID=3161138 RepID=UPI000A3390AC|nr:CDP-glycerol glycerophosphotransferase family protein [Campylobacter sp. P093]